MKQDGIEVVMLGLGGEPKRRWILRMPIKVQSRMIRVFYDNGAKELIDDFETHSDVEGKQALMRYEEARGKGAMVRAVRQGRSVTE